jgi:lipopolysaccharide export system protein LptC
MSAAQEHPHFRPPPKRLGAIRRASLAGMERYSHFVRVMKRALPAAAALVAAAVLIYALEPRENKAWIGWEKGTVQNDRTMLHPRLFGTDDSGSPFTVLADTAVQDGPNATHVQLHKIDAQLTMKDGLWVKLNGALGRVDTEQHQLDVTGGVRVTADGGYEAHSERAHFNLETGVVSGHDPVSGRGPYGTFTANGFEVHKEERQLVFTGGVHMLLHAATEPGKPGAAAPHSSGPRQ